ARFITKVLKDQGYINFDEPFKKLNHQGMILAEDGSKMSKSKGNVVIPEDYIKKYGADVFRAYVLFLAPFEDGGAWNDKGIMGVKRFIDKVWELQQKIKKTKNQENKTDKNLERIIHQTIKKVTEDIENFHFNTAISALMILVNELTRQKQLSIINYQLSIILLSPFAPHLAEELWEALGNKKSIFNEKWPKYNPKLIKEDEIELVIQINGKVRDKVRVSANITEPVAKKKALESEKIKKWVKGTPKKVIFIKGKLINIVT
ncbi:class I tRNA ligase family protein, partial [Candidatus Falkowbacteria bacterium]|nr:class I tRNA ligase family protein [Candidatus Falkowbacteria bacterium]